MGTEQFCLRWNDFHSNITSAFSEIRDEDDFLDVTLVSLTPLSSLQLLSLVAFKTLYAKFQVTLYAKMSMSDLQRYLV